MNATKKPDVPDSAPPGDGGFVPGQTVGHYKILDKLGEGGMGVVYRARDSHLDRVVAIKVLPAASVGDPARRSRFVGEAKAASALNHPNIITIHDIAEHDGRLFIVMEFVAGRTLAETMVARRLRTSEILAWAGQAAEGLARAHAAGLVHRDVKPSNIMVTESGLVKVLDFGLAQLFRPNAPDGRTMSYEEAALAPAGTPHYMSPEQILGYPLTPSSDIFSFGLMLYEMLTGARAFERTTSVEIMSAILNETPPELPDTAPAALRHVVEACLAKDPAERFHSARDLAIALKALASGPVTASGLPALPARAALRKRWIAPAAVSGLSVAALAAVLFILRPERAAPADIRFTPFAVAVAAESHGVWSPDGRSIAYLKETNRRWQLMIRALDRPTPISLTDLPAGIRIRSQIFWSPDGTAVYFCDGLKLHAVGVAGGAPRLILPDVETAALSPDGRTLVFWRTYLADAPGAPERRERRGTVWVSSPPGSEPRRYVPAPFDVKGNLNPIYLRFAPDGSRIGLSSWSEEGGEGVFWVLPWPDGGRAVPRRVFAQALFPEPAAFDWFPDARRVVFTLQDALWEGDTATSKTVRLLASPGIAGAPSVSPDGTRLVFDWGDRDFDLVRVPFDGGPPESFLATARRETSPSWSAAGDRMAFVTDRLGETEVWLRDRTGTWEKKIAGPADFRDIVSPLITAAVLAPGGDRIALQVQGRKGGAKIWVTSVEGGRPIPVFSVADREIGSPCWSPQGDRIAALILVNGNRELAVARLGTAEPPLSVCRDRTMLGIAPVWSPDGKWIANANTNTLYLFSPDGRESKMIALPVTLSAAESALCWSPDGAAIYVATSYNEDNCLDVVDVRTGAVRNVRDFGPEVRFQAPLNFMLFGSLAPDGRSFTTSVLSSRSDLWILDGLAPAKR